MSAKDFLPLSIISAVTRKRKKHQSACPSDSSSDEDSEHEPVKASNYGGLKECVGLEAGEGGGDREEEGGRQAEEEDGKGGEAVSCTGSEEEAGQEVGGRASLACQQGEEGGVQGGADPGPQAGQEEARQPRSFLYSQQSHLGQSTAGQPVNPTPAAHRLSQANPVTRKKLRGERARPRSLYVERGRLGEEPALERAVGLARVKASIIRGQERLRQAMSPSREPSLQQGWLGQVQANLLASANDLWRSGAQQRHGSPETRRRRRDWRRHTVVGSVPAEG